MAHCPTHMARVQGPAKALGEIISNVDLSGNVFQLDLLPGPPFLNGKSLDSDMPSPGGGLGAVDNVDHSLIVLVQECWTILSKSKLQEH